MVIDTDDFDEVYLDGHRDIACEIIVLLRNGNWFGQYSRYHGPGYDPLEKKLATRLCGSVFILTDDGESEGVRLRQALPHCNFIYPQIRFKTPIIGATYSTPYECDANRRAPFKMAMEQVTDEFRKTVAPYSADAEYSTSEFPSRLFWINDEVFALLKMKF